MHCKSSPPSFRSVKVNGNHYACTLPAFTSTHTDTHTQRNIVTLFLEGFTFLYPGNREKGWRRRLLFPWASARPEGRWKVGVSLWIPSFPRSFLSFSLPSLSFLCFARSIQLSARRSLPIRGSQSSITRLFPSSVPACCLELSGTLLDLNMAFRQLNMVFVMDGWWPRASLLG